MKEHDNHETVAGTNIEDVKKVIAQSGLSYNQAKEYIAKTSGGHGTQIYSDTDAMDVRAKNEQSAKNKKN